jgi:zinc/manganese transport system substrate-binding protein
MHFKLSHIICCLIALGSNQKLFAKLTVFATTTNVASLIDEVGGDKVDVISLTKGAQDPHYIEAKPSFMLNVSRADLLVSVGLGLEDAWLPAVIGGSRNPSLSKGQKGSLILGEYIAVLDIPTGSVSREQGDVHPDGNPHFMLDPVRVQKLAGVVAQKLAELAPEHKAYFFERSKALNTKIDTKLKAWQQRIKALEVTKIVTYHKTLRYFLDRFNITLAAQIEPKPGIPPSSAHILSMIDLCEKEKIKLILVENFFDVKPAQKIAAKNPDLKIKTVAVAVGGVSEIKNLFDLYEHLIHSLTN